MEFCKKLSERPEEKKAARIYRMPTEAEWEYACRAGSTTAFAWGNSVSSKQANFIGNAPYGGAEKGPNVGKTVKAGLYQPNAWGLYDMHGNVWEWCMDSPRAYNLKPVDDPKGLEPVTGARVMRGGSWGNEGWACRCAMRDPGHLASFRAITIGFRVLLER